MIICRTPTNCPHLSNISDHGNNSHWLEMICKAMNDLSFGHINHWEKSKEIPQKGCKWQENVG
jgi:hypothetical protein